MSNLNLKKPIVVFDIEATGLNIKNDQIVELAALKVNPNHSRETKTWRIKPTAPMSAEAEAVHGISMEDLKDCPTFVQVAKDIKQFFVGCDIAGYNFYKFDIPMLAEEFARTDVQLDFEKCKMVDVQNIFHKKEKRTLEAAYKFYCDQDLVNAHSASADTLATLEVLEAQVERYDDITGDIDFLHTFSEPKYKPADFVGFIIYNDQNELTFNFGKHKSKTLAQTFDQDKGYFHWVLNADFPEYTKQILRRYKLNNAR